MNANRCADCNCVISKNSTRDTCAWCYNERRKVEMSKKSQFEKHRARPKLDAHPALMTEDGRVCYLDGDTGQTFICVPDAEYENVTRIDITYFLNMAYVAGNKLALGAPPEKINLILQGFAMDTRVHYNNALDRLEGKETPSLSERRGN